MYIPENMASTDETYTVFAPSTVDYDNFYPTVVPQVGDTPSLNVERDVCESYSKLQCLMMRTLHISPPLCTFFHGDEVNMDRAAVSIHKTYQALTSCRTVFLIRMQ